MFLKLLTEFSEIGCSEQLLARSFDLSSAYRQLCVAESSRPFSYIAVYSPTAKMPEVFSQVCLPFGSKAAVNAFIRCSRCIQWIAAKCLYPPTTCYYDDFVVVASRLKDNSEASMSMLFQLLAGLMTRKGPRLILSQRWSPPWAW